MEWSGRTKEMIYGNQNDYGKREILASGCYKNYHYAVINIGTHPTAYVEYKNKTFDGVDNIDVHGKVTFCGKSEWDFTTCNYIGWDYMHWGDWNGMLPDELNEAAHNKKWTTEEILDECFRTIEYLVEREGTNGEIYKKRGL